MRIANPSWSRDELILALDLYFSRKNSFPGHDDPPISGLSQQLKALSAVKEGQFASFRNENSVYMKLANFRSIDPKYTQQGKKGLSRGGRLDTVVWSEYINRPQELAEIAAAIRANLAEAETEQARVDWIVEAPEGGVLTRIHQIRERSAQLVAAKKALAKSECGKLACEACDFDFEKVYGEHGVGFIEAHHVRPLHTLLPGSRRG